EPMAQLNIGSNFTVNKTTPDGGKARGHVSGRDPITGTVKWQVEYAEPPLASLLSTKGNLVFVPDARGWLHALDARTGKELWSHNDGQGHNGGIISYMAKGKQYIAVATGWGGLAGDDYKVLYGKPFANTCGWCHSDAGRAPGRGPQLMGTKLTDVEIVQRIKVGKAGAMPAFASAFSSDEIQAIVAYIRGLRPDGAAK